MFIFWQNDGKNRKRNQTSKILMQYYVLKFFKVQTEADYVNVSWSQKQEVLVRLKNIWKYHWWNIGNFGKTKTSPAGVQKSQQETFL